MTDKSERVEESETSQNSVEEGSGKDFNGNGFSRY